MAENRGNELKFLWKVENYSFSWNKTDEFIQSPDFEMDVFEGSSWCLKLYPGGVSSYERYISVHLGRLESSKGPLGITVDYEIALLRSDGTAAYIKETQDRCFRKGHSFGFDNLAVREEILGEKMSTLLPKDILTVQCRIFPKGCVLKSYTEVIAKTHIELERSFFIWKSENKISDKVHQTKSLHFFNAKALLGLKLCSCDGEYLSLFLFDKSPSIKVIHCKIGIFDANKSVSWILVDRQINDSEELAVANEIPKQKSLYLPNDILTLHCDLTVSYGVQHKIEMVSRDSIFTLSAADPKSFPEIDTSQRSNPCCCSDDNASFKNDIQKLYQEGTLCDFTLKVENDNIKTHKVVLGARSPVFKAMLTSNMKENEKNMVDISDLDVSTVRNMLTYMYTDTTGDIDWEAASKLYFAADKYGIMGLKRICSSVLERNFCVSNVGEALSLAHLHGDDYLKNLALEFVCGHDTEVMCSKEWKAFMAEEVQLAAETMHYIFMKKAEINKGKA